jgi:hypothetical protein
LAKLAAVIKADAKGIRAQAIDEGLRYGTLRGRAFLVGRSPVDLGMLKNAWDVVTTLEKGDKAYSLDNTAPYAGVVERGIQPGANISGAFRSLVGWIERKGLAPKGSKEAESFAWAIIKKVQREGRKGQWFVKKSMPDLARLLTECINTAVTKYFRAGGGTKGLTGPTPPPTPKPRKGK